MTVKISIQDIQGATISGEYVERDGMVTVTASDGRTTTGVIEDSMLTAETLAKTLLLQLHRKDGETGMRRAAARSPVPVNRKTLR
jgi:hypothetical protein